MHTDVHVCVCTHECMCVCMHTHFVGGGGGGGGEKKSCIAANLQKTNIICRFVFCAHCRQTLRGPDSSSLTILQRICLPLKLLFRVHGAHMKINGAGCCLMVCRTSFCTCVLLFFHSTLYWPWRRYLCRNYLHSGLDTHTVFTYIHTYRTELPTAANALHSHPTSKGATVCVQSPFHIFAMTTLNFRC